MSKKILILTASPSRDKMLDELIAEKLRALGNEVWVRPCLRNGRQSVLELQPDIVILPPVRNPYSRDMCETLKSWGIGVVSRHTEASCDWQDFKKMSEKDKMGIFGAIPYIVDLELVWGQDEAEILTRRAAPFKVVAVGSFVCDVFMSDYKSKVSPREVFNQKYKFDQNKKNLLIGSPWGFVDSAPDLRIDEVDEIKRDIQGRDKYIQMIKDIIPKLSDKFNILVTIHPGVGLEVYKKELGQLVPIDSESPAVELLANSDGLIHSGSTMAIQAHLLNIPAFQYGDVNSKAMSWFAQPESNLSKVSVKFDNVEDLINAVNSTETKTNANLDTLKILETGRFGLMDGKATDRAAELINKVDGKFKWCWPKASRDYDQLTIMKDHARIISYAGCGVCGEKFVIVKDEWLTQLSNALKIPKPVPPFGFACPHCGTRVLDVYGNRSDSSQIGVVQTATQDTVAV